VLGIQGHDRIAEVQRGRTDDQILESELNALGLLLAFDASHQPRDVEGHRMYGHIPAQPLNELQPAILLRLYFRAVSSVHKFGDGHHRESDLGFSLTGMHLFEDLPDTVPSAFGGDDHAGI